MKSLIPIILVLAFAPAVRAAEKPIDISVVCFKAEPGKDKFKIDERLTPLLGKVIPDIFEDTRFRTFTFKGQDRLTVANGGEGSVTTGGLTVSIKTRRDGDEVTLTVDILENGKSVGEPKEWKSKAGQWCIQAGPESGDGRLFVALMVEKAGTEEK
jgi:hypothetical protein